MALSNTATSYGSLARTFHWLIALGILIMIPLGLSLIHILTLPTKRIV
mgnify:CR=1 FL=1